MSDQLCIEDIKLENKDGFSTLSATVDGEWLYLKSHLPYELHLSAEFFVGVALLEAMASNRTIVVKGDVPISLKLKQNIEKAQKIYSCWNSELHVVQVEAEVSESDLKFNNVGSFFSAGVDSSHTLLSKIDEITHLVMCRSFDVGNDDESWNKRLPLQREFAESLGKNLIAVETNVRPWFEKKTISWHFAHGLMLCSMATALQMKKQFVPSSHAYDELFPWGSHPLTDPLWSTNSSSIVHHGASHRRTDKIKEILTNQYIADNLQVCWASTTENCGKCSKCVRTMLAIKLFKGRVKSLPGAENIEDLSLLKPDSENAVSFLKELIFLSADVGDEQVNKKLMSYYRNFQIKQIFPQIDRFVFNGFIRNAVRSQRAPDWLNWRVTLRNKDRWNL